MPQPSADAPILVLAGSNRPGSVTGQVARRLAEHYDEAGVPGEVLSLDDLPTSALDGDAYAEKPAAVAVMTDRVSACSGLHVVTPEYNGSFPGVLKLFIDLLEFPAAFEDRAVAFVGLAAGTWGGVRPVEHLSQIFAYRHAQQYPRRVFMPKVGSLVTDAGLEPEIDGRLREQCAGFVEFVKRH